MKRPGQHSGRQGWTSKSSFACFAAVDPPRLQRAPLKSCGRMRAPFRPSSRWRCQQETKYSFPSIKLAFLILILFFGLPLSLSTCQFLKGEHLTEFSSPGIWSLEILLETGRFTFRSSGVPSNVHFGAAEFCSLLLLATWNELSKPAVSRVFHFSVQTVKSGRSVFDQVLKVLESAKVLIRT